MLRGLTVGVGQLSLNKMLLLLLISSRTVNKRPFSSLVSAMFLHFGFFLLSVVVILFFKTTPKCGAKVLPSVPECQATVCLLEKTRVR